MRYRITRPNGTTLAYADFDRALTWCVRRIVKREYGWRMYPTVGR